MSVRDKKTAADGCCGDLFGCCGSRRRRARPAKDNPTSANSLEPSTAIKGDSKKGLVPFEVPTVQKTIGSATRMPKELQQSAKRPWKESVENNLLYAVEQCSGEWGEVNVGHFGPVFKQKLDVIVRSNI
jgi:hypothetical protein